MLSCLRLFMFGGAVASLLAAASPADASQPDPLLDALDTELARTMAGYAGVDDAPYLLVYRAVDGEEWTLEARYGAVSRRSHEQRRELDVMARVGSPRRDSSHRLREGWGFETTQHQGRALPTDGDVLALRTGIWQATDRAIQDAQESWLRVKADQVLRVADQDDSDDLAPQPPVVDLRPPAQVDIDLDAWEPVLAALSLELQDHPEVMDADATLSVMVEDRYVVDSDGTRIRQPRTWARVALWAKTRADDGMNLDLYRWRDVADPAALPDQEVLMSWARTLRADLVALRAAPAGEPYSGPVLLRGKAAGVFVHEVLGHRVEGHRQKDEEEGQTFKDKVGQQILPTSISIFDDPSLPSWSGFDLNGHYAYDEEGVPAQRAVLVERGVFRGFLMSRSPIAGFDRSNGHGRAQAGELPVSRMANTIVQAHDPKPDAELRRMLLAELKAQGRSWGLVIDEIGGGFTMTGRFFPNAFNVRAETAWKVYVDGRPDEVVRGIDLVGTPLVALANVRAAGDSPDVFNGFCGAESGFIPNSAVSPSLLVGLLEIQKKETGSDRPPLLPKPDEGGDS